jgi:hypothetical protein
MKRFFVLALLGITVLGFTQEKIRYGNIPYGISIETAIQRYSSIYDSCKEETYSTFFNCTFVDFTALRPMFQNLFGVITTSRSGYTSAWTKFDKNFTRILVLSETNEKTEEILYFLNNNGQSKLFMVRRRAGIDSGVRAEQTYVANKIAVTERLGVNPRELSGTYDYYNSGSRSVRAYTCIWEKNNERIVLYVADDFENTGGFMYISNIFWREYESIYIQKRNTEQNTARETAGNQF